MNDLTPTMNWLHSWSGLLFGWLSFVVFVTGTLTVFDNEITYWMQPEMQEATAAANRSEQQYFSSDLTPIVPVKWQEKRTFSGQTIDPSTGQMITFRDTQGGDFFYHFHYGLLFGASGAVIVSVAAISMLVALGTGLGVHRRTVKELVTFRPRSVSQRTWLEVHNLAGFLILPFHLMVTLTGLTILWSIFMPADVQFLSAGGPTLSVLSDLHFAQFGSVAVRWLYFVLGLAASAMIATGLILWTSKRRKSSAENWDYVVVESLNVATVAGLLVAIGAFFWANRLLPLALIGRSHWEERCFFFVWGLCLLYSFLRCGSLFAWRNLLYVAAFLLGLLPLLNAFTTNSDLLVTASRGQWALAGVDLTALLAGTLLGWIARCVGQAARETSGSRTVALVPGTGSEHI